LDREPCQKGTAILPVVEALKAYPDRKRLVPEPLWKYFDDHIVISGWYPERDYFVLIEALAKIVDSKVAGGDVWRAKHADASAPWPRSRTRRGPIAFTSALAPRLATKIDAVIGTNTSPVRSAE
jgi:hypothetical protein